MNENAKIMLSPHELELVSDSSIILTKQVIIGKVNSLFSMLSQKMQSKINLIKQALPVEIQDNSPKISKGENYLQLPYLMLDYPRFFQKEETLAIRCLFWWGNQFSISLHVSGKIKERLRNNIESAYEQLKIQGYWVCVNESPWNHYFEPDNFIQLDSIDLLQFKSIIRECSFLKIAKKIPLQQWDNALLFFESGFLELLDLIKESNKNQKFD